MDKKEVIWIDNNCESDENQINYTIFSCNLSEKEYNITTVKLVDDAFNLIENNKKIYFLKLFYVIVSGEQSKLFFTTYTQKNLELNILCYTIIFDNNSKFYEYEPFFQDPFLNPGGVSNDPEYICFQIKKIEYDLNQNFPKVEICERKEGFGNVFTYSNDLSGICFPLLLGKLINTTLIKEDELKKFQSFLLGNYARLKHLIKPSLEKNMEIPYHILAKFYAKIYTEETSFYPNMNKDLSNGQFDVYRIFIFLLYSGLNKNSLKSFYNENLYRGCVIGKNEFLNLQNNLEQKNLEENQNSEIKVPLYFCRNFLSFSKSEETAFGFMLGSNVNEYVIPVIFEIEKLKKNKNFFISNIDVEYISDLDEKEVLFLPLSCFEIKEIKEEIKNGKEYKRIKLKYLYKYRKLINNFIEKTNKKEGLQDFLNKTIQSDYGLEIVETLGPQLKESLIKYFEQNTKLECDLHSFEIYNRPVPQKLKPNFNPNAKANNPGFSNGAQLNKLYESEPTSMQRVFHINGDYDALILRYKDGSSAIIKQHQRIPSKVIVVKEFNELGQRGFYKSAFTSASKEIPIEGVNTQEILKSVQDFNDHNINNNINYIKPENNLNKNTICSNGCKDIEKLSMMRNNYYMANACGTAIGYFFANIDRFAQMPMKEKAKIISLSSFPMILNGVGKASATLSKGIPFVGMGITAGLYGYQFIENIKSESLTKSEVFKAIFKDTLNLATNIGITTGFATLGMKIGVSFGFVSGPGAIGLGLIGGTIGGILGGLFSRYIENKKIKLLSDCLYYKYIPYKYREFINPNLHWKHVDKNTKSYVIELIENDFICKWRVINIPPDIRIFPADCTDIGETIIEYQGISKNANKIYFCIYELNNKEELKAKDWEEPGKIQKMLINVAILEVS